MLKLVLPWPPSTNAIWRHMIRKHNRTGKYYVQEYLSAEAKQYRLDAQAAVFSTHGFLTPIREIVGVQIFARPPDHRARDLDNLLKSVLDALSLCRVIADDSQIDDLRIVRGAVKENGQVEVTVMVIEQHPLFEVAT